MPSHINIIATPDWSREAKSLLEWHPSKSLLASISCYQTSLMQGGLIAYFVRKIAVLRHRFWSVVTGADIPLNVRIEGGLLMPHPNGIVIHHKAEIGANCLIFQQVTIGRREGQHLPKIGAHVDIGAGAKILGAVNIGDYAKIGANAVVLKDVPCGKTAVGIPAKIID